MMARNCGSVMGGLRRVAASARVTGTSTRSWCHALAPDAPHGDLSGTDQPAHHEEYPRWMLWPCGFEDQDSNGDDEHFAEVEAEYLTAEDLADALGHVMVPSSHWTQPSDTWPGMIWPFSPQPRHATRPERG